VLVLRQTPDCTTCCCNNRHGLVLLKPIHQSGVVTPPPTYWADRPKTEESPSCTDTHGRWTRPSHPFQSPSTENLHKAFTLSGRFHR